VAYVRHSEDATVLADILTDAERDQWEAAAAEKLADYFSEI